MSTGKWPPHGAEPDPEIIFCVFWNLYMKIHLIFLNNLSKLHIFGWGEFTSSGLWWKSTFAISVHNYGQKYENCPTDPQKRFRTIFLADTLKSDPKTPTKNLGVRSGRIVEIWVIKIFRPLPRASPTTEIASYSHLKILITHISTTRAPPTPKFFEDVFGPLSHIRAKKNWSNSKTRWVMPEKLIFHHMAT